MRRFRRQRTAFLQTHRLRIPSQVPPHIRRHTFGQRGSANRYRPYQRTRASTIRHRRFVLQLFRGIVVALYTLIDYYLTLCVIHLTCEQLILWYPNPPQSSQFIAPTASLSWSNMDCAVSPQYISHLPFLTGGVIKNDWYISAGAVKRWHVSFSGQPSPAHFVMSVMVLVYCAPHDPI